MRFTDIKQSMDRRLTEAANAGLEYQHTVHDIDAIKKAIPQIDPSKSVEKQTFKNDIKTLLAKADNAINLLLAKNKDQPIAEDPNVVGDKMTALKGFEQEDQKAIDDLDRLKAKIQKIYQIARDPKEADELVAEINEDLDKVTKNFESVRQQRDDARAERDTAIKFIREVTGILTTLGNKVQGYQLEDSDKMNAAMRKKAVNAEKFTKTLKQALFGKIIDMQEDDKVKPEDIKQFLQACVDGKVLNMTRVIDTPRGNLKQFVNGQYSKVFDAFIKENIFSYSPGTTSGAIGPGEMALSMMGNPAEKGKKGDLKIGKREIEVKASAKTGGRLNSKKFAKATTGWAAWSAGINAIMQTADESRTIGQGQKDGTVKQISIQDWSGKEYNYNKAKKTSKEGSRYNWSPTGFRKLNEEVLRYSNFDLTFKLFRNAIDGSQNQKGLVQNYDELNKPATNTEGTPNEHHKPFNPDALIAAAVKESGQGDGKTIDFDKITPAFTKIAYASYHLADGITEIMLLNTSTLDYTMIKDAEDFRQQMVGGNISAGSFSWNDDQQTATPGYMTA
jgi:hypothetical protein